ncbi:MAG: excinuclease ABC subunit UvrB [Simkaniaceae bacterium]|nr:excinuclease ABC subunit UvrB [Simkaniaceae bacterium]
MSLFRAECPFKPCGDQPAAIKELATGIKKGKKRQVLLGITGSGKTYTMANVIAEVQKPTLILAHNKTLAAQLYQEFKAFFPHNAVEYFVSYYDYYQPEAYIARTDTYIEKDLSINDRIDKLRLKATCALLERPDVIIVASVSCIYGLGMPEHFKNMRLQLRTGHTYRRDEVLLRLVELQYTRNHYELARAQFRVRGDILEVVPAYEREKGYRVTFFGDEIERIDEIEALTGKKTRQLDSLSIYPASHHVTPEAIRENAVETIKEELRERIALFERENLLIERQRIEQRTKYDLEMIKEIGYCKGIENYSRHFSRRLPGEPPSCLLDYFPDGFLLFVDESHQTLPQIRAMYNGDRARKKSLIDFGFRLPSAYDNRPLTFEEFYGRIGQAIFVSATPAEWEIKEAGGEVVEQIIRPTGLLDPLITVKPAETQVDDCLEEIAVETGKGNRVLVTVLTKKLAEDLTKYLTEIGVKAKYLHADIDTLERIAIIKDLRQGTFDVLVGINLLREGLDIPEVALVAILDADKEGFLRSETSLIQTCGRVARNVDGRVIMYADKETESIKRTISITHERRKLQEEHNIRFAITPRTIRKKTAEFFPETEERGEIGTATSAPTTSSPSDIEAKIKAYEQKMREAARNLSFEEAAHYRDRMNHYKNLAGRSP